MFCLLPVKKLSMQITSWPSLRSRSLRWEPMKPAPPVIKILLLMMACPCVCSFRRAGREASGKFSPVRALRFNVTYPSREGKRIAYRTGYYRNVRERQGVTRKFFPYGPGGEFRLVSGCPAGRFRIWESSAESWLPPGCRIPVSGLPPGNVPCPLPAPAPGLRRVSGCW